MHILEVAAPLGRQQGSHNYICLEKATQCVRSAAAAVIEHWVTLCTFDGVIRVFRAPAVCPCKGLTFVVLVIAVLYDLVADFLLDTNNK